MYSKIIEEVCREPLGEIQIENKWRENKMEGGQGLYRTLRWGRDFSRVCGEPFKNIRYWRRLFQDPERVL
jgi:hypothetical protein